MSVFALRFTLPTPFTACLRSTTSARFCLQPPFAAAI